MMAATSRAGRFDTCRTLSLSVLHMREVETVATFMKLLAEAVSRTTGVWNQTPNMVVAGLRFQTRKRVIAVVEILCILDGILKDGNCYSKVVPSDADKGYFNCLHAVTKQRLTHAVYRRQARKLLVTELQKIVKSKMDYLPSEVFRIGLAENYTSILVLFRFYGCKTPSLGIELTPAIAGKGLPEGTNDALQRLFQRELATGGPGARWYLIPPHFNRKFSPYSWRLTLPMASDLIPDFRSIIPSVQFLAYVAEVRQWCKMGLQEPHNAILSLALAMDKDQIFLLAHAPLEEQLAVLFQRLQVAIMMHNLPDFATPARNYLDEMTVGQRVKFATELQMGFEHLQAMDDFVHAYVGEQYPLPLPEYEKKLRLYNYKVLQRCQDRDCISELSTEADYFPFPYKGGDSTSRGAASDSSSQVSILNRIPSTTASEMVRSLGCSVDKALFQRQMLTLFVLLALAALALVLILPTMLINNETSDENRLSRT